jgi:CubicO group peptidase (beta-lactamase class C family)
VEDDMQASARRTSGLVSLLTAVLILGVVEGVEAQNEVDATIDSWARPLVEQAFSRELSPGLSVAVVTRQGTIWTWSGGKADLESGRAVTDATSFYIASTSKALLALAVALRADSGALDLDQTLAQAFPGARFPAAYDASSATVRDLLTHTHGIHPRGPISLRVAFSGDYDNELLLNLLGEHGVLPDRSFVYSNLGYDLAGILLDRATTRGWADILRSTVLEPLAMHETSSWVSRLPEEQRAMPHELGANGFERIRLAKADANMGPAGGQFASARDLARLVEAELTGGMVAGQRVFPEEVITETQRQQVAQEKSYAFFDRFGWGLGWDLAHYESDIVVQRFGSFAGYRSHVSFIPERGIGVVALTNGGSASSRLTDIVACALYDHVAGRDDVQERLTTRLDSLAADAARKRADAESDQQLQTTRQAPLPHPIDTYIGHYVSASFGTLEILRGSSPTGLVSVFGVQRSPVEFLDVEQNIFRVKLLGRGSGLEFQYEDSDDRPGRTDHPGSTDRPRALVFLGILFERQ